MKEKMYYLALRKRQNKNDCFWKHDDYVFQKCEINTMGGRYWFADPFVFEHNNKLYIFYEAFDLVEKIGKLGYSVLEGEKFSDPQIVIVEKCHLSFPYIFVYNDDIYIMPESSGDYNLKLYRAINFPDKWEIKKKALPDVYACDSIFVEKESQKYLLTNEMFHNTPVGKSSACWVKNYIYKVDGIDFNDSGTKVCEGDFGTRNAGAMLNIDGKTFRIGQDCRNNTYGKGMVLFEIKNLTPYEEEVDRSWDCGDIEKHIKGINEKVVGCHTYNVSEHYEVIDFAMISKLNTFIRIKRLLYTIYKILKKGFRCIKQFK